MPVWAQILLPLIAFVWVALLVGRFIAGLHDRRRAADDFSAWMRQPRNRIYFRNDDHA